MLGAPILLHMLLSTVLLGWTEPDPPGDDDDGERMRMADLSGQAAERSAVSAGGVPGGGDGANGGPQ